MFECSPETLTRGASYFEALLGGRFKAQDEYFIDRSPDLFQHILQFLRTGGVPPQGYIENYRAQLLIEASFYGIDHLTDFLKGRTSVWDLPPCDRGIKLGVCELIDVFSADISERPAHEIGLPLLPQECQDRPTLTCGAAGFLARLDEALGGALEGLLEIPDIAIAGGAVAGCLTGKRFGDVDIFLTGDLADAEERFRKIFDVIASAALRKNPQNRFLVLRSSFAVSIFIFTNGGRIGTPIQIVLNVYESVVALLDDFVTGLLSLGAR